MDKIINSLTSCPLFREMSDSEISEILSTASYTVRQYNKGEYILTSGEKVHSLCIVISGSVHIIKEDFWGNTNIIAEINKSGIFAESYAFAQHSVLTVSAVANIDCTILFINSSSIINTDSAHILNNLLLLLSSKNLHLNEKLEQITKRTTRDKLLAYLSCEAQRHNSDSFEIPFNRQQLADYLSIDRSAMCAELSKMQKDGIISYNKNVFRLIVSDN